MFNILVYDQWWFTGDSVSGTTLRYPVQFRCMTEKFCTPMLPRFHWLSLMAPKKFLTRQEISRPIFPISKLERLVDQTFQNRPNLERLVEKFPKIVRNFRTKLSKISQIWKDWSCDLEVSKLGKKFHDQTFQNRLIWS